MTSNHAALAAALVVLVPVVLVLMARIGDVVPFLLMFGSAAFMLYALPPVKPVTLYIAVPLGLVVVYKMLRGDGRGTKGGRLP